MLILRRTQRDIISSHRPSCRVRVKFISVRFLWKLNFFYIFLKILKYQLSRKLVQCKPSCLFHADGWKDKRTKRQTGRQTWRSQYSLLATLLTSLKRNQKPQYTKYMTLTFSAFASWDCKIDITRIWPTQVEVHRNYYVII